MRKLVRVVQEGLDRLTGRAEFLREYRARWARQHPGRYRDLDAIARYFQLTADRGASVDGKTWNDLDMDQVFSQIENSVTLLGRQYLYKRLRTLTYDSGALATQHKTVDALRLDAQLREDIQYQLLSLKRPDAGSITTLLFGDQPERNLGKAVVFPIAFLSLGSLVLTLVKPALFPLLLAFIALNFLITEKYSHGLYAYSQGLSNLVTMLRVGLRLGRSPRAGDLVETDDMQAQHATIRMLHRKFRLLTFVRAGTNDFTNTLTYYLNLLCLLDLVVFLGSIDNLKRHSRALVFVFERVASIDAAISVASYLESISVYCHPELKSDSQLQFENCYHPLVHEPKANSIRMGDESILITGTNMAGKTTFIKTVGLNVILGQTIWICHAESARFPRMAVRSSIKRQDSLREGKSYYLVEIEDILSFLNSPHDELASLILIDEVFRGTNTIERIAASASVLNALAVENTVLVTSHDVELQRFLVGYTMYHFRENPDLDRMFDYQLHHGPSETRNAIKLLGLLGYPPDIVDDAQRFADALDASKLKM
jgi:hypothetical protein